MDAGISLLLLSSLITLVTPPQGVQVELVGTCLFYAEAGRLVRHFFPIAFLTNQGKIKDVAQTVLLPQEGVLNLVGDGDLPHYLGKGPTQNRIDE